MDEDLTQVLNNLLNIVPSSCSPHNKSQTQEDALQFLINHTRSSQERKEITSKGALKTLISYLSFLLHNNNFNPNLISNTLRALRNLCAGEGKNQTEFIEHGGLELCCELLLTHYQNETLGLLVLQVLGNVCQAGEYHQSAIWILFFPKLFTMVADGNGSLKVKEVLCMVLYTCCKENGKHMEELVGFSGSRIVAALLKTKHTASLGGDWLELLMAKACLVEPYFDQLFQNLSCVAVSSGEERGEEGGVAGFCPEQAYLLSEIAAFLAYRSDEFKDLINDKAIRANLCQFVVCIMEILKRAMRCTDCCLSQPMAFPSENPSIDVIGYSLSILRDMFACEDPSSDGKDTESSSVVECSELIPLLLQLLRDLGPPNIVKKACEQTELESTNPVLQDSVQPKKALENNCKERGEDLVESSHFGTDESNGNISKSNKICPYKGFRRDLVSVLANASFRRKHVQDKIRECNGLFFILQHCVLDENNPFLREWGLWAVRNLLEGNPKNQQEISELQLQDSVNTSAIVQMGLKVEVDPSTRTPKLVNLSS